MEVGKAVRVVSEEEMVSNHVAPEVKAALELYAEALRLMEANKGQWVEINTSRLCTKEHNAIWDVVRSHHPINWWEARYPEVGTCVLYGFIPEPTTSRIKRWLSK